jgi:hypothetical protein
MVTAPERLGRLPRRRLGAIPLADAAALQLALKRTTIVRLVLCGSLVALAGLAVWRAANLEPRAVSFLPENSTTVVVIDQSRSIFAGAYRRIAALLRKLAAADVPVGLVAFSDAGYELLPPGARSSDLRPLLRFYTPARAGGNVDPTTSYLTSPWDNSFAGGTRISVGLDLAQSILHRDHVRRGTILLVSDLQTSGSDQAALAQSLVRITHDSRVQLKVLPLFALATDVVFFGRFIPRSSFVDPAELRPTGTTQARRGIVARTPWSLLVVCAVLLAVLAANELLCGRLQVKRPFQGEPA